MDSQSIIIVTSTRKKGEWTATATLNGQFAGSSTSKSKKYAEDQARGAGEYYRRNFLQAAPQPTPALPERVGVCSLHTTVRELPEAIRQLRAPKQQFDTVTPLQAAVAA